jgi:glycosyltransferase involved in cell wall biosynthesis
VEGLKALVVVSHVNSARTLGRCLVSLRAQDAPCKVVVVDGGSTDGSIDIANEKGFPPLVAEGCSEAKGQILGVEYETSDVILFTNSDCYVPRDWVSRHLAWQERGFDMVGGKLFWGGDDYGFAWSYWTPGAPNNILTSGLSLGFSNCSVSRALYGRVGLRDMKSQQDMDFWIRATKAGARLALDPKIEVYHDHPMRTTGGSFKRAYSYGKNHVMLLREGYGRGPWPNYASWPYSLYTLEELLLIRGVKVWKQQRKTAASHDIYTGLPRFLALRLLAFKIPNLLGWLGAMVKPVGSVRSVAVEDAHKWGR